MRDILGPNVRITEREWAWMCQSSPPGSGFYCSPSSLPPSWHLPHRRDAEYLNMVCLSSQFAWNIVRELVSACRDLVCFVVFIARTHFFSLSYDANANANAKMVWQKCHRLDGIVTMGEQVLSADVLPVDSTIGSRRPLPAFEFPSAVDQSAAGGQGLIAIEESQVRLARRWFLIVDGDQLSLLLAGDRLTVRFCTRRVPLFVI